MIKKAEWISLWFASLIVLVFALEWAVRTTIHFQKDVVVPDLTGKSLLEAVNTLSKLNLGLKQDGAEMNESVPVGTVLRQQPPSGMSVREGKIVRATLSQGGESIFVPDLAGQSLRSAEIALRLNNLSLGEVRSRPSIKYEKDIVISQEPRPNTILQKNSFVHLVVSDGPPRDGLLLMPDFAGKPLEAVNSWAKDLGIKVETTVEESPQETDIVLKQSVAPDDAIQSGSSIVFVISKKTGEAKGNAPGSFPAIKFRFEVPQGESGKQFSFVLVDGSKTKELWKGSPDPGSKLDIPLTENVSTQARIRIFV